MAGKTTSARTVDFYVSPAGNDRWSGRHPDPADDGKDGPLATLAGAQAAVRRWKKQGRAAAINVWIRAGTYDLSQPVVFTPADSGTVKHPVVYAAYPGESAVFRGGKKLIGWSVGRHKKRTCWTLQLPDVKSGRWNFTQLFVNGERRSRPRFPNEGFFRFAEFVEGHGTFDAWCEGPDRMRYARGNLRNWKNLPDVELVTPQLWFETRHRIRTLDENNRTVYFKRPSIGSLMDEKGLHARYYVENVFESFGEPGQWYLDRPSGRLRYLPLPGEKSDTTEVIAPVLEALVVLRGVSNLRLENLVFRHAEWTRSKDYVGDVQAAYSVPGAVIFDRAEDCVLYGCEISRVLQYAVEVRTGSVNNKIVACSMFDLGAGGVKIGHEELLRVDETSKKTIRAKESRPMRTTVSDCTIHDTGKVFPGAIGVWIGNSGFHRVRHNHLYNLSYTGVSCGWTWGYKPTRTADNRVEYNHIHHVNPDHYLSDNGGIYTLGPNPGMLIRGNVIHDIGYYGYGGWGIYQDEGTSQSIVEENIVYRTKGASFFTHYARDNVIRNNIFALAGEKQIVPYDRRENHRTSIVEKNILYWTAGGLWYGDWKKDHSLFRDNLFWAAGREIRFSGQSLQDMRKQGQLLGTRIADPLFQNPSAGDFTLRDDSPAKAMGFQPLDATKAGPRYHKTRPASHADWPAEQDAPREIVFADLEWTQPLRFDETPGKVRLTLKNVGETPARGKVRFVVSPKGAGRLVGGKTFAYSLKPGASASTTLDVHVAGDAEKVTVETIPVGKGLLPSFVIANRPRNNNITIPKTSALASPTDVRTFLRDAERHCIQYANTKLAEVSFGLAGSELAVLAEIHDQNLQPAFPPWKGSSLEVFGAPAGVKEPHAGQVFLVPGTKTCKSQTLRQSGMQTDHEPTIRLQSDKTPNGYTLAALIPLNLLNVKPKDKTFLLEGKVNLVPTDAVQCVTSRLFGINSYTQVNEFGTASVEAKAITRLSS
ncbi:MAG: right-handed parallel beta-helix repeat-containing protein [Phycisphaerae bacterium]|nr:right-handed parallel beta-helix repeat-containing protein [Phycisphaerae bacterium]